MKQITSLIKNKWLMKTLSTVIFIILIILAFIIVNKVASNTNPKIADLTKGKLYTLSEKSKEIIKNIDQNVKIYLIGYDENSTEYILGKQCEELNDKINCIIVNSNQRPDLVLKFGATSNGRIVAIEGPDKKYKVISSMEMIITDNEENKSYDLTEEKLTNAIQSVTVNYKPKIYFTTGSNEYGIESGELLELFGQFIINDINEVIEINLQNKGLPEDCELLIISNPTTDFSDIETARIQKYIKNGGSIMWMQNPSLLNTKEDGKKDNINKILDEYGIRFGNGIVCETNSNQLVGGNPTMFSAMLVYHPIVKDIYSSGKVYFFGTTRIENKPDEELKKLNVDVKILAKTTSEAYYKTTTDINVVNDDTPKGTFNLAEVIEKDVGNNKKSRLVAIGTANFVSGLQLKIAGQESTTPIAQLYNREMALRSVAYLTNRQPSIKIRKNNGTVTFSAPASFAKGVVAVIILILPMSMILAGIIIPTIRRKRK